MSEKPRRRWFQFGLRTMFVVVTVFAVWLGSELNFVRARQAALTDGSVLGKRRPDELDFEDLFPGTTLATIPIWRKWLGDNAYQWLSLPAESTQAEMDRIKKTFPEARMIVRVSPRPAAQRSVAPGTDAAP
jgi:hypothetical protein